MSTYARLCGLYRRAGFRIVAGIPREFSRSRGTEFSWLFQKGRPLTYHLGISPLEIYFLESLFQLLHPSRILVIGNSFGWSSFALAMLNPDARVLTIEVGEEPFTDMWIELSNEIADREGLAARAIKGRSPDDLGRVIAQEDFADVDFALIDGAHSPSHIRADFEGIFPHASADALFVFHDVVGYNLWDEFYRLARQYDLTGKLLLGTTSGIGLLLPKAYLGVAGDLLEDFGATQEAADLLDYFREQEYSSLPEEIDGPRKLVEEEGGMISRGRDEGSGSD